MKKLILLVAIVFSQPAYTQVLKRTYYDWMKTVVNEEYFVNSKGEKNGAYKKYSENGVIELAGTMKNGYWHGQVTTYSTLSGRQSVESKETFVDGIKEGPAVYYNALSYPVMRGNFKDGQKDGAWTLIEPFDNSRIAVFTPEERACCSFIKYTVTFKNGRDVTQGNVTYTFYPSNKIAFVRNFTNGLPGEGSDYWPNGQLAAKTGADGSKDVWDRDGKLTYHYSYSEEKAMREKLDKDRAKYLDMIHEQNMSNKAIGDSAFKADDYKLATTAYSRIKNEDSYSYFISDFNQSKDYLVRANAAVNSRDYNEAIAIYEHVLSNSNDAQFKGIVEEKYATVRERIMLDGEVNLKLESYRKAFVETDDIGERYIRGEYLYKKSKLVIDIYVWDYIHNTDAEKTRSISTAIKNACDRMIEISTGKTKELNKQLKDIEDVNEIKKLLKI